MNPVNFQWKHISGTAAGTTTVFSGREGVLQNIVIPANKTGTADFYDVSSAAGTSSTNLMYSIANTVGTIPTNIFCNHQLKSGLIIITGGTTDFTISFS